ncbi:hypothetical protein THRCLA_21134 [Thraustotheca clavata]|uniref:Uncharacterized protein n=1 Tax=Thraustotheca clavata TaxID=74557 RepID=A0A1W0A045_9STRA|nr:hypothetical protein THRCLA_21134 [Thraustotheca clavata]
MGLDLRSIFRAQQHKRNKHSRSIDYEDTDSDESPTQHNSKLSLDEKDIDTKLRLLKELLIEHDTLVHGDPKKFVRKFNKLIKNNQPVVEIPDCYKETRACTALVSGKMIPYTMYMVRNKRRPRWGEYPLCPIVEDKKEYLE